VHQRVNQLRGAGAEHHVLIVDHGVADGPVQPPDVALQLHGLEEGVGGEVAHAVPPREHHSARRRVPLPVRLQEQWVSSARIMEHLPWR
jgi:hypothetical protein